MVVCHATYLINLGASDPELYEKSVGALRNTMAAAEAIAADGVVFHLGSHLGRGLDAVLPQVTEAMAGVLAAADPASPTRLVIENSAGAGGTLGVGLDEIEPSSPRSAGPRGSACASTPATCGRRASTSPIPAGSTRSWPRSTSASASSGSPACT